MKELQVGAGLIAAMIVLLSACSPVPPATVQAPTTASAPGLQGLIEKAREDLARRLSVSVTEITFIEAMEAEWSDSSLGCPQPGMDYLQVVTPGYRILLEYAGNTYEYHSNRDNYVVRCDRPPPAIRP